MALINPIQIIAVTFLALVALPLAVFSAITTWIAFSILFLRLLFVYVELGLDILRYFLWDRWWPGQYIESPNVSRRSSRAASPSRLPLAPSEPASSSKASKPRRRAGSSSSSSISMAPRVAFSGPALMAPSNALERDFEGVGGWRIQESVDTIDLNSRLEFPDHHHRHHCRSNTHAGSFLGSYNFGSSTRLGSRSGPHSPMMTTSLSPNSPRSRTPTRARIEPFTNSEQSGSYFPFVSSPQLRKIAA